jgi:hypothetical protein
MGMMLDVMCWFATWGVPCHSTVKKVLKCCVRDDNRDMEGIGSLHTTLRLIFFRNEGNICFIDVITKLSRGVEICYQFTNVLVDPRPRQFLEGCIEAIGSRAGIVPHLFDNFI